MTTRNRNSEEIHQTNPLKARLFKWGTALLLAVCVVVGPAGSASAGMCEKKSLDESSKYVSCLLKEASAAAKNDAEASYEKCDGSLLKKEASVNRTCRGSSVPSLSELGAFLGETTEILVGGVVGSLELPTRGGIVVGNPADEHADGGGIHPGLAGTVVLNGCDFPPVKLSPEACTLDIDGVKVSCQQCNFELQPTGPNCSLEKVLISAAECHVHDSGGEEIPVVQEP